MNNKTYHLVHLGKSGFPFGMAEIEKIRLLSKGLLAAGIDVTVINQKGVHDPNSGLNFPPEGEDDGIRYIYASGDIYRQAGFISRQWQKIKGRINEIRILAGYRKRKHLDAAIIHSMMFSEMLFYFILSRLFGFKFIYLYVELNSSMTSRRSLKARMSDWFQERFGFKLADGVLPISKLLTDELMKKEPDMPYLKVPVICDFTKFDNVAKNGSPRNFLYVGSADYAEVILFIMDAFDKLDTPDDVYLFLVIGGSAAGKKKIHEEIGKMRKSDKVKTFSGLPYPELVQKYIDATALLIPMRPTLQDAARFPHKIGEYLASANPLITTNYGEVQYYFKDKQNALVADTYEVDAYAEKMKYVIEHPQEVKEIGSRGKTFGIENFDCIAHGKNLKSFLFSLSQN